MKEIEQEFIAFGKFFDLCYRTVLEVLQFLCANETLVNSRKYYENNYISIVVD